MKEQTPIDIAKRYILGYTDALTESQEIKDLSEEIEQYANAKVLEALKNKWQICYKKGDICKRGCGLCKESF